MSVTCQSIRTAITIMPTRVSRLCAIGGKAITIAPSDAAVWLIRDISSPVRRSSWKVSDRRWQCSKRSLRRSRTIPWSIFVST